MTVVRSPTNVVRLKRRIIVYDKPESVPSTTIRIIFEGKSFSSSISLFYVRFYISPYIPRTSICYNCYRPGHSKACKSSARCLHCSEGKHNVPKPCKESENPACCINCKDSHLATSPKCPKIEVQKRVTALATTENIPVVGIREKPKPNISLVSKTFSSDDYNYKNFPLLSHSNSNSSPNSNLSRFNSHNLYNALGSCEESDTTSSTRIFAQALGSKTVSGHNCSPRLGVRLIDGRRIWHVDQEYNKSSKAYPLSEDRNRQMATYNEALATPNKCSTSFLGNDVALARAQEHDYSKNKTNNQSQFSQIHKVLLHSLSLTLCLRYQEETIIKANAIKFLIVFVCQYLLSYDFKNFDFANLINLINAPNSHNSA